MFYITQWAKIQNSECFLKSYCLFQRLKTSEERNIWYTIFSILVYRVLLDGFMYYVNILSVMKSMRRSCLYTKNIFHVKKWTPKKAWHKMVFLKALYQIFPWKTTKLYVWKTSWIFVFEDLYYKKHSTSCRKYKCYFQ